MPPRKTKKSPPPDVAVEGEGVVSPEDETKSLFDGLMVTMRKKQPELSVLSDPSLSVHVRGVVSTGSEWLDYAIGIGGWPLSRMSLLAGKEGAGKTTLALQGCANAQRAGGLAAYIEPERKIDKGYARAVGVDTDRLIISHPGSTQDVIEIIQDLVETFGEHAKSRNVPFFIAWDSLNATMTDAELEGKDMPGSAARALSIGLKKINSVISEGRVALLMLSQLREKIGAMHGPKTITGGGNAPRFYSAVIAELVPVQGIKEGNPPSKVGIVDLANITKNQVASPFAKCNLSIRFGKGIDYIDSLHLALRAAGLSDGEPSDEFEVTGADGEEDEEEKPKSKKKGKSKVKTSSWSNFVSRVVNPETGDPYTYTWQGASGLRKLIAEDPTAGAIIVHQLRSRYGWGT